MRIVELISNEEFNFNVPFRIIAYDFDDEDESEIMYDSEQSSHVPLNLYLKDISAINVGDDGIIEIEYPRN